MDSKKRRVWLWWFRGRDCRASEKGNSSYSRAPRYIC
jgi:hypothetical protein